MKTSAGLLLYRFASDELEVFLVHPGGPFWAKKDRGSWSIPKGELDGDAEPLANARREFREETGTSIENGPFIELMPLRQPGGKLIMAWAVCGDIDPSSIKSNLFSIEWPPRSGTNQQFPEVDRGGWFTIRQASEKMHPGQLDFLDQLQQKLALRVDSTSRERIG